MFTVSNFPLCILNNYVINFCSMKFDYFILTCPSASFWCAWWQFIRNCRKGLCFICYRRARSNNCRHFFRICRIYNNSFVFRFSLPLVLVIFVIFRLSVANDGFSIDTIPWIIGTSTFVILPVIISLDHRDTDKALSVSLLLGKWRLM